MLQVGIFSRFDMRFSTTTSGSNILIRLCSGTPDYINAFGFAILILRTEGRQPQIATYSFLWTETMPNAIYNFNVPFEPFGSPLTGYRCICGIK